MTLFCIIKPHLHDVNFVVFFFLQCYNIQKKKRRRIRMKYLKQFSIIALIALAGETFNHLLPLPIPASIYGIVILLILLMSGMLKVDQVKDVSSFLIEIMPVMFIPAAVGLLESFGLLMPSLAAYAVIIFVSTVAVMAVSGLVTQAVIRKMHAKEDP